MAILMLGAGLQGTLLGLRATIEGFPTPVTGLVMSCYYVGYLLGTLIAPRLLRRIGHVRVFAAFAALASVAALVHASWVHPLPWGAMRLTTSRPAQLTPAVRRRAPRGGGRATRPSARRARAASERRRADDGGRGTRRGRRRAPRL